MHNNDLIKKILHLIKMPEILLLKKQDIFNYVEESFEHNIKTYLILNYIILNENLTSKDITDIINTFNISILKTEFLFALIHIHNGYCPHENRYYNIIAKAYIHLYLRDNPGSVLCIEDPQNNLVIISNKSIDLDKLKYYLAQNAHINCSIQSSEAFCNIHSFRKEYFKKSESLNHMLHNAAGSNKSKIEVALQYINENFRKSLNMAMVSNHVSINYTYFSCLFKKYTGLSFLDYLKIIRIEQAKRLLQNTDHKIYEVAEIVGFKNAKKFSRIFKEINGISPNEYRYTKTK